MLGVALIASGGFWGTLETYIFLDLSIFLVSSLSRAWPHVGRHVGRGVLLRAPIGTPVPAQCPNFGHQFRMNFIELQTLFLFPGSGPGNLPLALRDIYKD